MPTINGSVCFRNILSALAVIPLFVNIPGKNWNPIILIWISTIVHEHISQIILHYVAVTNNSQISVT